MPLALAWFPVATFWLPSPKARAPEPVATFSLFAPKAPAESPSATLALAAPLALPPRVILTLEAPFALPRIAMFPLLSPCASDESPIATLPLPIPYPWLRSPIAVFALWPPLALALGPQAVLTAEPLAVAPPPLAVPGGTAEPSVLPTHTNWAWAGSAMSARERPPNKLAASVHASLVASPAASLVAGLKVPRIG